LLTALYADGHYGGAITIAVNGREAAAIAPLDAPSSVAAIDISVTPGPRFTFGDTNITPAPQTAALPEQFRTGAPAQTATVRRAVSAVVSSWQEQGFAKAAPSAQQITARHSDNVLNVNVTIATGPRLTFGPLTVSGNEAVRTDRILAIAGLPTGEVYSPDAP